MYHAIRPRPDCRPKESILKSLIIVQGSSSILKRKEQQVGRLAGHVQVLDRGLQSTCTWYVRTRYSSGAGCVGDLAAFRAWVCMQLRADKRTVLQLTYDLRKLQCEGFGNRPR